MRDTVSMLEDTEALLVMPSLLIMARCSQLWTEIMMTIIDTTVLKTLKGLGGSKSKLFSFLEFNKFHVQQSQAQIEIHLTFT